MTKQQIETLINDGEIWPVNENTFKKGMDEMCVFKNPQDKLQYYISTNLVNLLRQILQYLLDNAVELDHYIFLEDLAEREKIYLKGTELHTKLIYELIQQQDQKYRESFTAGTSYHLNGNFGNTDYVDMFFVCGGFNNIERADVLIKDIKFTYLNESKIDKKSFFELMDNFQIQNLITYFSDEIIFSSSKLAAEKNILHLHKILNKVESVLPKKNEHLSHYQIALLSIFNGVNLYSLEACKEAIVKYNPTLRLSQADQTQKKYKSLIRDGALSLGDCQGGTMSANKTGLERINAIKKVMPYIKDKNAKESAENIIIQIENYLSNN